MGTPAPSWQSGIPERWAGSYSRSPIKRPRLLLADDHSLLLDALRHMLEREFTVLRTVTDGAALVEAANELRPDVVLCDISMPGSADCRPCSGFGAAFRRCTALC